MLCREKTLLKDHAHGVYAAPLCCRSWTCDYCRPERKARVAFQARKGAPERFVTCTSNPARFPTAEAAAQALAHAWSKFTARWNRRHSGKHLAYLAVMEATKLGWPHIHILCRGGWIDQRELSDFMRSELGAPIVHVKRCDSSRQAARYVAKYLGKDPHRFATCKRYWMTQDYLQPTGEEATSSKLSGGGWYIVDQRIDDILLHHTIHHHEVTKLGPIWQISVRAPP